MKTMTAAAARKIVLDCLDYAHKSGTGRYMFEDAVEVVAARRLVRDGIAKEIGSDGTFAIFRLA